MTIGEAVAAMREGRCVRQRAWVPGKWIAIRGDGIEWGAGAEWRGIGFMCGPSLLLADDWEIARDTTPDAIDWG